jgi:hypothetical protein
LSKIFDALKQAELAGVDRKNSPTSVGHNSLQLERRRTCRVRIDAPLFVYGYAGDNPFHEDACTVEINAHGGLISMHSAVRPGEKLLVMNKGNESTQQCVVLSVRVQRERAFHVGFAFPVPMPQFWQNLEIRRSIRLGAPASKSTHPPQWFRKVFRACFPNHFLGLPGRFGIRY